MPADNRPLEQIASDFQLGLITSWKPTRASTPTCTQAGSTLIISPSADPAQRAREGIVINVAEMRLYYYPKGKNVVHVPPIGQPAQTTRRTGSPRLSASAPTRPGPDREHPSPLCRPGQDPARSLASRPGCMGLHALYIGNLYAIRHQRHLRHRLRVSSGCVRLRADDIKYLFDHVPVGTRVQFVNQPVKTTVEPDGGRHGSTRAAVAHRRKSSTPPPRAAAKLPPDRRAFQRRGAGTAYQHRPASIQRGVRRQEITVKQHRLRSPLYLFPGFIQHPHANP